MLCIFVCCNKSARNLGRFPKFILIHSRLEVVHCQQFSLLDESKCKLPKNQKILFQLAACTVFQSYAYNLLEGRKEGKKSVTNCHLMTCFQNLDVGLRIVKLFPHLLNCTNSFSICELASAVCTHLYLSWCICRNRCEN